MTAFLAAQFVSIYGGIEFIASMPLPTADCTIQNIEDVSLEEIVVLDPFIKATAERAVASSLVLSPIPLTLPAPSWHARYVGALTREKQKQSHLLHNSLSSQGDKLWLAHRVLLI